MFSFGFTYKHLSKLQITEQERIIKHMLEDKKKKEKEITINIENISYIVVVSSQMEVTPLISNLHCTQSSKQLTFACMAT